MNIQQALVWARKDLKTAGAGSGATVGATPDLDAEVLLGLVLGRSREYMFAHSDRVLMAGELRRFRSLVRRRGGGEPVAYITRVRKFFGLDFSVSRAVLIPRPDTEILVERVLDFLRLCGLGGGTLRVLDIGTGSGCVAVSIKKHFPTAEVMATDISGAALQVARKNARRLGAQVKFVHSDLLASARLGRYDVIVSNPPYLTRQEAGKRGLHFEPRLALAPNNMTPRQFFKKFLDQARDHLTPGGRIFLEIGHRQAPLMQRLARSVKANATFHKDLAGIERVAEIKLKK